MAEELGCKAVWLFASHGAWGTGGCVVPRCSGTQVGGRGIGPSADQVVRAGAGQPFCCQHDYSCLMTGDRCQAKFHRIWEVEV